MAVKKETNKNWWNQVDFVEEVEQRSLQVLKIQKEWIEASQQQFGQLEENSKKLTSEWKTNAEMILEKANFELEGQNYQDWFNKLEEIGHKTQTIATLPGKTSLEMLEKSNSHFEEMVVKSMAEAKKVREEATKAIEGAFEQMKQTQSEMFKFFEFKPFFSK